MCSSNGICSAVKVCLCSEVLGIFCVFVFFSHLVNHVGYLLQVLHSLSCYLCKSSTFVLQFVAVAPALLRFVCSTTTVWVNWYDLPLSCGVSILWQRPPRVQEKGINWPDTLRRSAAEVGLTTVSEYFRLENKAPWTWPNVLPCCRLRRSHEHMGCSPMSCAASRLWMWVVFIACY